MPTPLHPARLILGSNECPSDALQAQLSAACQPLRPPSAAPGLRTVLTVVATAVEQTLLCLGSPSEQLLSILDGVIVAAERAPHDAGKLRNVERQFTQHAAWTAALAMDEFDAPAEAFVLFGAWYCLARASGDSMSDAPMVLIRQAIDPTTSDRCGLSDALSAATARALETFRQRFDARRIGYQGDRVNAVSLAVAIRLQRTVSFSSARDLRAIELGADLQIDELQDCLGLLRVGMEAGDVRCGLIAAAYWIGLPIDLLLSASVRPRDKEVVSVRLYLGVVAVDFGLALSELATTLYPGTKPAEDILLRPLPLIIQICLLGALEQVPEAHSFRDLLGRLTLTRNSSIPGADPGNARHFTVARVIAARAWLLIKAKVPLSTVAYASLDMRRFPKSGYPYSSLSRQEIWNACVMWSDLAGWGKVTPLVAGSNIGSISTPTDRHIQRAHGHWAGLLDTAYPGNHAGLERLIMHHNLYAAATSWFLALVLGLREATCYALLASMVLDPEAIRHFGDKRSTPKPMPPLLCCPEAQLSIRYWLAHCSALLSRLLSKPLWAADPQLQTLIRQLENVGTGRPVALVFVVSDGRVAAAGTATWTPLLKGDLAMKEDFGRHLWPDWLRDAGLSTADSEALNRHVTERREWLVSTSARSRARWMERVFSAQEGVLDRLGLRAFRGLSKS